MKKDPRVDAYIARSADFAKPILRHLREIVHEGCPECDEDIKWGHPSFTYKGIMAGMAAFKSHATFGFWRGGAIVSARDRKDGDESGMGQFGRITSVDELPSRKVLLGYVKEAAKLQEAGAVAPKAKTRTKPRVRVKVPTIPVAFKSALAHNRKAQVTFEAFAPSHRKEYVEWIAEAKTEETRDRRIETALGWLAEGKRRNWKYER
jgi:uncharacterized protein YdeI (YjbR/CyaY-like superfamily)